MSFPAKLKELRLSRNLTEQQLADQIGVSLKTYKNYEAGRTKPRIATIIKLVRTLDATTDELLDI